MNVLSDKVTIVFIIKLLKSKNLIIKKKYNIILVIVDRLLKYSYIISFKEKYKAKQLEIILIYTFIQYYKILKRITCNRDKFFMSNY